MLFVVMLGLGIVRNSITGMVSSDYSELTNRPLCSIGKQDCEAPQVCCQFYEENQGVCHKPEMCLSILELTKQEKESSSFSTLLKTEKQQKESLAMQAIYASFTVVLVIAIIFLFGAHKPNSQTSKKRKRAHLKA